MEYVGAVGPDGYDRLVVRGSLPERQFTAFWAKDDGGVLAGMHANDWDATEGIRQVVGRTVDLGRLADESVELSDVP
jgi:3-phenylpropionate/trans-cinnamate dioxygenase ferredoxin reductase subunit